MDHRDQLVTAIALNDVEEIKKLLLLSGTTGIVVETNGMYFTIDQSGIVSQITNEDNARLDNVIRIWCNSDTMPLVFQV